MLMLLEGDLLPRYSTEYQAPVAQCPWSVPGCSGQQGRGFGQVPPAPTSSLRGWLLWAEPLCFDTELSGWRDGLGMTHCPTRCAHWCRLPAAPPPPGHAVELSARLSPLSKPTGEPHLEGGWHGGARAMCLQMAVLQPSGSWEILFFILFYFLFFFQVSQYEDMWAVQGSVGYWAFLEKCGVQRPWGVAFLPFGGVLKYEGKKKKKGRLG